MTEYDIISEFYRMRMERQILGDNPGLYKELREYGDLVVKKAGEELVEDWRRVNDPDYKPKDIVVEKSTTVRKR